MELHYKLASWLYHAKRDYPEGLELYMMLGIDRVSEPFFRVTSPTKLHQSLLFRALAGYAGRMNIKPAPVPNPGKSVSDSNFVSNFDSGSLPDSGQVSASLPGGGIERPKIDRNPVVRYEELPVNLQVLFDENGRLHSEMKSLHARLKTLKEQPSERQQRALIARELVSRQAKSRSNWDQIDGWWAARNENVETPEEKATREALEKDRRIKANLNYIRRYFGKEKYQAEVNLRMVRQRMKRTTYQKTCFLIKKPVPLFKKE
jgi:hypothetical protein